MQEPWEADPARYFEQVRYVPLRSLLDTQTTGFLDRVSSLEVATGRYQHDGSQVVGSRVAYGAPVFETLLADLAPDLSSRLGIDLVPTYSFVRCYREGMELAPHTDRPSCEISVTIHLGSDDDEVWPLLLEDGLGSTVEVVLRPGDAVAYRGCDVPHWRARCPSTAYRQVFLHYVDVAGPHAHLRFDGRTGLGQPAPRARRGNDTNEGGGR